MKYFLVKDVEDTNNVKEFIYHAPNARTIQEYLKKNNKPFYNIDLAKSNMSEDEVRNSKLEVYELTSDYSITEID